MSRKTNYKGVSKRSKDLLSLEETYDIEFKRNAKNLKREDIVAFANSKYGGTIFIGINESVDDKGRQKTEIVGCEVGDNAKQNLLNLASSCSPPVELEIFLENEGSKPFYRIEIPTGNNKPYCSSGGTYKIRKDGRKESLLPQDLLRLFMAEESGKFLRRFKESTIELRNDIQKQNKALSSSILESTREASSNIHILLNEIDNSYQSISQGLELTEAQINKSLKELRHRNEELNDYRDYEQAEMNGDIRTANENIIHLAWKLNALLDKFDIEDPEISFKKRDIKLLIGTLKGVAISKGRKTTKTEIKKLYDKYSKIDDIVRREITLNDFTEWFDKVEPII